MTRWIGIDGEGVGNNPHRYVMLCAADSDGWHDYVEDVRGLSTEAVLSFLISLPKVNTCGYFLGYDWTMALQDLPNRSIYRLFRPELRAVPKGFSRIHFRGYQLHYLSTAMQISYGRRERETRIIWDLARYYQCSFLEALKAADIPSNRRLIERMKGERGSWGDDDLDRMREYCLEECRALSRLACDLEERHDNAGLKPRTWYGPGSTASLVLRSHAIQERRGVMSPQVHDAAERAYFGGRFEQSTIGRHEGVYGYDITSAYPAAARNLPCLEHGHWKWVSPDSDLDVYAAALVQYHVEDIGPMPWGPLPCRLGDGNIVYARGAFSGWAWRDEYLEAVNYWTGIRMSGAWVLERDCDCRPFGFVDELYKQREVDAGNKRVYKYALNSLYGKLAQRTGNRPFHSVIWAGLITSGCRAQLLRMLGEHSDMNNVLAVATDGLYSTEWHACPDRPKLGDWARDEHGAMWFIRPGIYWAEADETLRARGIGRRKLREQMSVVKEAIYRGESHAQCGTTRLFGSARECVYKVHSTGALKRSRLYGQWFETPARISLTPHPKRNDDWSLRTLDNIESKPYGDDEQTPDGTVLAAVGRLLSVRH